jgi:hypothetical protein
LADHLETYSCRWPLRTLIAETAKALWDRAMQAYGKNVLQGNEYVI